MPLSDIVPIHDLQAQAIRTTKTAYDRTPNLITDQCLEDAPAELAEIALARSRQNLHVVSEVITMPKRAHGVRPINILSTVDRLAYEAVVAHLRPQLPAGDRKIEHWTSHTRYGTVGPADSWLMDFDISACYEFIDHGLLADEILIQSAMGDAVAELKSHLGKMFPRTLGLPQMLPASDALADTFLLSLERRLLRAGLDVSRYADDFRVVSQDEEAANHAVEIASNEARALGLSLSANKTLLTKVSSLKAADSAQKEFIDNYRISATEELTVEEWFETAYGIRSEQIEPEEEAVMEGLFHQMLTDWSADTKSNSLLARMIPRALDAVSDSESRVDDQKLITISAKMPLKMPHVLEYLTARTDEGDSNAATLMGLAEQKRLGPWARIHLVNSASRISMSGVEEARFKDWATAQLQNTSEVVRASAAWFLAETTPSTEMNLGDIYRDSSALSRPALAATLSRRNLAGERRVRDAAKNDGALNRAAATWGEK